MSAGYSHDWGTPPEIVALARTVMGGIDLDPFSSAKWNDNVNATFYLTESVDGFGEWGGMDAHGTGNEPLRVFMNPPGPGSNVKRAWQRAHRAWMRGAAVFWVSFAIDDLQRCQGLPALGVESVEPIPSPMSRQFWRCVPRKRIRFLDGTGGKRTSPMNASALVYMPPRTDGEGFEWSAARGKFIDESRVRFISHAARLGDVA